MKKPTIDEERLVWTPQPKQVKFMERSEYEALYGGAAGGGKSDALVVEALRQVNNPDYRALILRKTYPQLEELIDRSHALYPLAFPTATYNDSKHVWRFKSGAKIYFGAMQHKKDRTNYQGKRYDFIGFDELTHFTWDEYSYMFSRNRPSKKPRSDRKTTVYMRATANPGGVGHGWVKNRFITAAEPNTPIEEIVTVNLPDGSKKEIRRDRVFIPASVFDNPALLEADPNYLGSLALLPEKEKKALLYGDWDSFEGQFFDEFRIAPDVDACKKAGISTEEARKYHRFTHVIEPFDLGSGEASRYTIFRSYDWGYARPFSCAWYAVDYDGTMYRILELYGCRKDQPNIGVRWTDEQQFAEISRIEREHPWLKGKQIHGIADPSIWASKGGPSTAETAMSHGIYFTPGDNERIAGWQQCRYRLQFDDNGYARFYVFSSCEHFIRTIPLLLHDETKVEDLDSKLEDHIADEWRYACMSRPIKPVPHKEDKAIFTDPLNQFNKTRRKA